MVAAGVFVDLGRAAEFAPDDHRDVFVEPAKMQVFDQGREGHVELGNAGAARPEVLAVRIPAAERDRHHPGTGLDQAAGHQEMVHAARRAIGFVSHVADAIPCRSRGSSLVRSSASKTRREARTSKARCGEAVHPLHGLVAVERPAEVVELAQERPAAEQALGQ